MAINDTIQLSVQGTVAGQAHIHTLHFRFEDVAANEAALIAAWQASCRTAYRALFVNVDSPCQTYVARQVCGTVPLRAPVEVTEVAPNIVGANAPSGDRVPSWLAAVTSVRTALAGKSRRGRFFLGGLYEVQINGNELIPAHVAAIQAYCAALTEEFIDSSDPGENYRLVVHSHKLASVPGTQCQDSSTPVTGFIVRSALGSMKSRKPGNGT